jgi:DNA-binding NarL/FixJ family response regulator
MDIAMPLLNGIQAARQIRKHNASTKVLILSMYQDDEYVYQAVQVGVAGYLVKQTAANELLTAIREVKKGYAFFSPSISRLLVDQYRETCERKIVKKKVNILTPRELEVLQLIAEGQSNKQIAAELSISIKTVEKHRQQIMDKLSIHDVAGLTRYAIAKGIIESK